MRDRERIGSELRGVPPELRSIRERGGQPSSRQLDALLDERLGHPTEALWDIAVLDEIWPPADEPEIRQPRKRRNPLLRLVLHPAMPLSPAAISRAVDGMV